MVDTYQCSKCKQKWQMIDGVDIYNQFAFSPSNNLKLSVCRQCRVALRSKAAKAGERQPDPAASAGPYHSIQND